MSDQGARALVKLICNPTACRSLAIICVRLAQPELEVRATHTHHTLRPLTHLPSYLIPTTSHPSSHIISPLTHMLSLYWHPVVRRPTTPTHHTTATTHSAPHQPTHPHAVSYATHHLLSCSPYPSSPPPPCRRRSGVPRWKGRRRDGRPWSCSASRPTTTTEQPARQGGGDGPW